MYVYEPAEDSYLLAEILKERRCKRFLDMGCGTGIQAQSVGHADEIVCVDINPSAVEYAKKKVRHPNARFVVSDLFRDVKGRFDLIAFNSPYLDAEPPVDTAWTYLQGGRDIIEEFIKESARHLEENGEVLLLLSDRDLDKYMSMCKKIYREVKVLKERNLFFEKLIILSMRGKK